MDKASFINHLIGGSIEEIQELSDREFFDLLCGKTVFNRVTYLLNEPTSNQEVEGVLDGIDELRTRGIIIPQKIIQHKKIQSIFKKRFVSCLEKQTLWDKDYFVENRKNIPFFEQKKLVDEVIKRLLKNNSLKTDFLITMAKIFEYTDEELYSIRPLKEIYTSFENESNYSQFIKQHEGISFQADCFKIGDNVFHEREKVSFQWYEAEHSKKNIKQNIGEIYKIEEKNFNGVVYNIVWYVKIDLLKQGPKKEPVYKDIFDYYKKEVVIIGNRSELINVINISIGSTSDGIIRTNDKLVFLETIKHLKGV